MKKNHTNDHGIGKEKQKDWFQGATIEGDAGREKEPSLQEMVEDLRAQIGKPTCKGVSERTKIFQLKALKPSRLTCERLEEGSNFWGKIFRCWLGKNHSKTPEGLLLVLQL